MAKPAQRSHQTVPRFFAPILWSHPLAHMDPRRDKKTIIIQTVNYGDLPHWRWIIQRYGKRGVKKVLTHIPATELRARVRPLAATIFHIEKFHYAPRGPRRQGK